jgi:hypothetical protein
MLLFIIIKQGGRPIGSYTKLYKQLDQLDSKFSCSNWCSEWKQQIRERVDRGFALPSALHFVQLLFVSYNFLVLLVRHFYKSRNCAISNFIYLCLDFLIFPINSWGCWILLGLEIMP